MEVVTASLTFLSVLLLDDYYFVNMVEGISICQSDCDRITGNNRTRLSSFRVHCTKLLGFQNSTVSTLDSARGDDVQNSAVNEFLKTCSAAGRLIVTKRDYDVCVETKGTEIKNNATRLLIIASKSYRIHLKTYAVQDFYFPWRRRRVNSLAYMRTVNQFVIGFQNELATSTVKFANKTTLRRGIYVKDIAVDEEENIIFVTRHKRAWRYDLCTVTQKGTNFKSLAITNKGRLKFDIDRKHKLVYVCRKGKVTYYNYQGLKIDDLVRNTGFVVVIVYNPLQDVLYLSQGNQLKMITKQGILNTVYVNKHISLLKSMKIHANHVYMMSSHYQVFVLNVAGPPEFNKIKVPKTRIVYDWCLF